MFGTRFKVAAAAAAVTVVGFVGSMSPMAARAESSPLDVIIFRANTTQVVPPVPAILNPITPTCITSLGAACPGTYQFSSANAGGICEGISVDTSGSPELPGPCTITSNNGHYTNIICGTGTASDSTATVSENTDPVGSSPYSTPYTIVFVGGVGIITGTATDPNGSAGPLNP